MDTGFRLGLRIGLPWPSQWLYDFMLEPVIKSLSRKLKGDGGFGWNWYLHWEPEFPVDKAAKVGVQVPAKADFFAIFGWDAKFYLKFLISLPAPSLP